MPVLATDNFNRANADPISGSWTDLGDANHFIIDTNTAIPSATNDDAAAFYNAVTWPNDQYSQVKVTVTGGGGGGSGIGPLVRGREPGAGRDYYRLVIDHAGTSNVELAKRVNGAYTQLWLRTQAFTNGDTLYLEIQGTTLIAKLNGTAIGASQTDTAVTTGNAGIVYSSLGTAPSMDDWEGGDFAAAADDGPMFATRNAIQLVG